MSGYHNQYQKPDNQCPRCGEVSPAEIHTCTPQLCCEEYENCTRPCTPRGRWLAHMEDFKYKETEFVLKCKPAWQGLTDDPIGWIYEDDEGRMMFSQMPHPDPLWEPVYRKQK